MKLKQAFHIDNDINNAKHAILHKEIGVNAVLSRTYIILLTTSTIICSLGLLTNSTAIVIGGMIISPLMWPLMKVSLGITAGNKKEVSDAIFTFFISIIVVIASSFLITLISPIKSVNSEILIRSQPTILDVFIALSAGAVAGLGLIEKKISSMLAGVAIATSLMPPLCVAGMGFALSSVSISFGSFLLFLANVLSIIFVTILIFHFSGIKRASDPTLRKRGILFVAIMLCITILPLFYFLKRYSFRSQSYLEAKSVLEESFETLSEDIYIENLSTEIATLNDEPTVIVNAEVLIPETIFVDFEQRKSIIQKLEQSFQRNVKLNLRIQKTIALQSEQDKQREYIKNLLKEAFSVEIATYDESLSIDNIEVISKNDEVWYINAILRGDPLLEFTEIQRQTIESHLAKTIKQDVILNLEIISRIQLKAESEIQKESLQAICRKYLSSISDEIDYISVQAKSDPVSTILHLEVVGYVPESKGLTQRQVDQLKLLLQQELGEEITMSFVSLQKTEQSAK